VLRTVAAQHAQALSDLPWAPTGSDTLLEGFSKSANTVAALMKGVQQRGNLSCHPLLTVRASEHALHGYLRVLRLSCRGHCCN
jgi:hypothetical protein